GRGQGRRPPLPATHQPAQRVALGVQDFLRPCSLSEVPARSLLPVPRLPDRALRGGGLPLSQHTRLLSSRGAAAHSGLRGRPLCVRRTLHHHPGGLHLRARAGQVRGQCELQHGQAAAGARRQACGALMPGTARHGPASCMHQVPWP
ncbi:interleukin 17D, partial [Mus musculus]